MKSLMILASVMLAFATGQGPEGGEGTTADFNKTKKMTFI